MPEDSGLLSAFNQLAEYLSDGLDLLRISLNLTHEVFASRIDKETNFLATLKTNPKILSFEEFKRICQEFGKAPETILKYCLVSQQCDSLSGQGARQITQRELDFLMFKKSH